MVHPGYSENNDVSPRCISIPSNISIEDFYEGIENFSIKNYYSREKPANQLKMSVELCFVTHISPYLNEIGILNDIRFKRLLQNRQVLYVYKQ